MTDILHQNSEGDALKNIPLSKYITERTPKEEDGVRFLERRQKNAKCLPMSFSVTLSSSQISYVINFNTIIY